MRSAGWAVAMVVMMLATVAAQPAHAQVGARDFVEPIVTEDANPSNELTIVPGWNRESHSSDFNFAFSIEKQLSDAASIQLGDSYNSFSRRRERTSEGFDNPEILAKWAFLTSNEHEFRIAIGADIFVPLGDASVGAETHTRGGPLLMWEKGMGDVADTGFARYLRPFAIQGDMGYLPAWGGPESGEFVSNAIIDYSIAYLAAANVPMPDVIAGFDPFVEFNYEQIAIGRRTNSPPDFRVTPGLAYVWGPYQITLATQVALNRTASHNDQAAVIGLIDIMLDEMLPAARWKPF
jgi:hypothetical protein